MLSSPLNTRRWVRDHVEFPVRIAILNELILNPVSARGTEISKSGMAVHCVLASKPGDLMRVQFPASDIPDVTAMVRNRQGNCSGLEFLSEAFLGNALLNHSTSVCNPDRSGTPEPQAIACHSCDAKILLAGLRKKQVERNRVQREIEALNLAIPLLADDAAPSSNGTEPRCGIALPLSVSRQPLNEPTMKPGDYVKVMGRDGFYVFLKSVQGMATLRVGGAKSLETLTLVVPIDRVISLEKPKTVSSV